MDKASRDHETRRVVAGTLHGTVEGNLRVSTRLRTLDFLNRSLSKFVTIQDAEVTGGEWKPDGSSWSVSVATIQWVAEVEAMRPRAGRRHAPLQNRTAVRLCMPSCEIRGFLHTPALGDPIGRLNQDQSAFFAVTSASLMGADTEFAAAFLAVNRSHVVAAEALLDADGDVNCEPVVLVGAETSVERIP